METDAAAPAALTDDVLAAILGRLLARSLATSRCVCKAWRDLVDERGLLERIRRLHPHSVSGIFTNYADHDKPHFFARPMSAAAGPQVDGRFSYVPGRHDPDDWFKVLDHCNGLVLYQCEDDGELYVCNPTTRECTHLPQLAVPVMSRRRAFLAFSPAVSQHYQVLVAPVELVSEEEQRLCYYPPNAPTPPAGDTEWPPSQWTWHVFSSRSGRWQETVFLRQGEAAGIVADLRMDSVAYDSSKALWHYAVHRQGALYVHCRGEYVTRLSLLAGDYTYRVIKSPIDRSECSMNVRSFLGKSKGKVHFAAIKRHRLRVWMLNDSQRGDPMERSEWILKHDRVLQRIDWWRIDGCYRHRFHHDGPWILDDYYSKRKDTRKLDWSTDDDDDNAICSNADGEEEEEDSMDHETFDFLGFHPRKEVIFLSNQTTTEAHHLNTSKVQFLGLLSPAYWNCGLYDSFVYTPFLGLHHRGLSLSAGDYSYRVIKSPIDRSECRKNVRSFLGRSKGEVYFVAIKRRQLRVWMLNDPLRSNDPTAGSEWILKHDRVLQRIQWRRIDGCSRHIVHQDGPWILDDYFNKRKDTRKLDWSTDDDDNATCSNADREEEEEEEDNEERYMDHETFDFLGFHPYKEAIFLSNHCSRGPSLEHLKGSVSRLIKSS